MKMRSYRNRNALLSGVNWQIGLFLLLVVVLFVALRLVAPGLLTTVASPLWRAGTHAAGAVGVPLASFTSAEELRLQNERLVAERAALQAENAVLSARLADLSAPVSVADGVPAGVLSRPPVAPYDTLVVALGDGTATAAGARVFAPGGIPIGVVESATARTARIVLYSEAGRKTEGWVGEARNPITLTGESAGAFSAIVPRESEITEGETVYLPGPGAVPIGYVVRIARDPSSPEARVFVRPVVNPFSLTWVILETASYE